MVAEDWDELVMDVRQKLPLKVQMPNRLDDESEKMR